MATAWLKGQSQPRPPTARPLVLIALGLLILIEGGTFGL